MTEPIRQGEVVAPRRYGPFRHADVVGYADVSGDDNPLHVDQALAARAGLPRPPIHGMLVMGCFEGYLRDWRPAATITKLSAKFIRPVVTDEVIEVSGKVVRSTSASPAVLRLTVKRVGGGDDLVCLAEAFVLA